MTATLGLKFAALIAFCAVLLLVLLATYGIMRLRWWPECAFQVTVRPTIGMWRIAVVLIAAGVVLVLALPLPVGLPLTPLVWLTVAPHLAAVWINRAAWKADALETRRRAARVRNRLLERRGEDKRVSVHALWAEYVIDEARAARQARYRPPGS